MNKPAPKFVVACYKGPLFWQRIRILLRVLIDLHRIERRTPIDFSFMLF